MATTAAIFKNLFCAFPLLKGQVTWNLVGSFWIFGYTFYLVDDYRLLFISIFLDVYGHWFGSFPVLHMFEDTLFRGLVKEEFLVIIFPSFSPHPPHPPPPKKKKCGYSLEATPWGANDYPQPMFLWQNKRNCLRITANYSLTSPLLFVL